MSDNKIGKKEITIILSIIGVGIAFFGFVFTNRPIVDYSLSLPIKCKIGETVYFDDYTTQLDINAQIRNRGVVDASVNLILTLENASFVEKNSGYIYLKNDTVAKIYTKPIAKQDNYVYFTTHITPDEGCESFAIEYQVEVTSSDDFFENVMNFFLLKNAWTPNRLVFNKVSNNTLRVK